MSLFYLMKVERRLNLIPCIEVEVEPMDAEPLGLSELEDDFCYGYFDNHDGGSNL